VKRACRPSKGFSVVELLVVVAIIAVLASIVVPAVAAARELARVAKVHAELKIIGNALEAYAMELKTYPPVRVSCNPDMRGHEYQLPVELADTGYLPKGTGLQRMVAVEDAFQPGCTYKYNAPGDLISNNSPIRNGNYLWVPDQFPTDPICGDLFDVTDGKRYNLRRESPVLWVLWSVGRKPDSDKVRSPRAPVSRRCWYMGSRDEGIHSP